MNAPAAKPAPLDPLERVRRHIEADINAPSSLADLAAMAGLSAYHFSRQFTARFGESPMAYIRLRRMAAAAARLGEASPPTLVELAFDCGFDSQEGFTRAFKRAFGVSPGRYRRKDQEIPIMTLDRPIVTQAPDPVQKPALRIAGLTRPFDDSDKARIPELWTELFAKSQPRGETYGVCAAAGENGAMLYTAGFPIGADEPVPEGLEVVDLAPRAYLVFRMVMDGGPLHPQVQAAMKEIWGERVPASGHRLVQAPDLEYYPPDFRPDRAGAWIEWWVPVEA